MIRLFALSSQADHVHQVLEFLRSKELPLEHWFTDKDPNSEEILAKNNLTIQPVLFDVSHVNGVDVLTKFAEGSAIMQMGDELIEQVKAKL